MNPYEVTQNKELSNEYVMSQNLDNSRWFMRGMFLACALNMLMEYVGYDITFHTQGLSAMIVMASLVLTDAFNLTNLLKS